MTTILHVSDLHYERPPERLSVGIADQLARARADLVGRPFDLLVASGDLTSYGTWDARELLAAKRYLEGFGRNVLAIPGNHDLGANRERGERYPVFERYEPVPWDRTNFGRIFGGAAVVERPFGDVLVVGIGLRRRDDDGALAMLERAIARATTPVVVVGHYPLQPVRQQGILASFGAAGYVEDEVARLREMLSSSGKVVAYLCGHVHASSAHVLEGGLLQLSAGALGPGPALGWLVRVERDEVRFEQVATVGPEVFWPAELLDGEDPVRYHRGDVVRGSLALSLRAERLRT